VNERDVVLSEKLSNASSVGSLVTRNLVSVKDRRKTGNVEGCSGELTRSLGKDCTHEGKRVQERAAHLDEYKLSSA
jgi:hypothetical protein